MDLEAHTVVIKQELGTHEDSIEIIHTADIKLEQTYNDYGVQCDRMDIKAHGVDNVKMENQSAPVQSEKLEDVSINSIKLEDMDTLECDDLCFNVVGNEQFQTKYSSLDSSVSKTNWRKELQGEHMEAEKLFFCYNCNYTACSRMKLVQHISAGECNMITNLDKSRVARPLNIYVCSQCNKVFKKKTTLDEHVIKKHEIFERKDCYYKTTDEINLKKHNLIHSGANSELFSCHYCNAKLKRRQILDNHIVRKHPDFLESVKRKIHECSQCMYKTVFKPSFKRHLLMHGDIGCSSKRQDVDMASNIEPFVCYNCNYSAHSKGDLILHISVGACYSNMYSKESRFANTGQQPSKTYSCLQCSVVFKKKTALDEHCIKKHTDSITSVSSKIHECTYCNYKTTKKTNMTRHMVKHPSAVPKLSKCKYCNASFINGEILDNHVLKKHPAFEASIEREIFECLYCPYKTIVKRYYNEHMKVHFRGEQQSICEHCNAAFKSKRLLDAHIVKQHPKFIASVTSKIHKCSYCTYKTIHNGHFDAHLLIHSKGKTPTCEHCASTFKRKQLLNNHILKKHSDVFGSVSSKVSCQQCHVKFEGRQSLNKHMMETHPDHAASVKIILCKHCTMTFNSKYDLDDHIVRKHQEFIGSVTRKVFECSYCSYKTVRTNKSEKHILSHRRKVGLNQTPIKEEQTTDST